MFYSSFYTPFQYSFYPYFMPSFARPIGFVVSPDGAMDNWWGKKPSWWGKITPSAGVFPPITQYYTGSLVPYSLRSYY
ncbi:hypothetical protein ACFX4Y_19625 [Priestia sp. YIM B13446]|jgi:hypothetical protein|nr:MULTISPECIES: hypothetical protein [Priestia]RCX24586.1 hypothetical protein DEU47_104680 [Bacillus sp. AG236]TCN11741.1 hypothetical protein EV581_103107 [Bacillus sp. BK006]KNH20328.1 hypothetical protein ACS78_18275 [Priestia megaterium]KWU57533.1 hypothetical protein AWX17_25230 [Priestia megaterium]MBX9997758.1 hypothetical protein [Priestia aryabhattai]